MNVRSKETAVLRPVASADYAVYQTWFTDPSIYPWLAGIYATGRYNRVTHEASVRNANARLYTACLGDRPVGCAGLTHLDRFHRNANVWYVLGDRALGGRGLATEFVNLVMVEAFGPQRLKSLWASVAVGNEASMRVLLKNGFRQVGIQRACHRLENHWVDRVIFDCPAPAGTA